MPNTEPEQLDTVAVGIVRNDAGAVLITQRPPGKSFAGEWEFPGGKLQTGEDVPTALARELLEEVGLTVLESQPWSEHHHTYSDRRVVLHVWRVLRWSGTVAGLEGQAWCWAEPSELSRFDFLQADRVLIEALEAETQ